MYMNHICNGNGAKGLQKKKIEQLYVSKIGTNKFFLKKMMHFKYKDGNYVVDYLNEFQVTLICLLLKPKHILLSFSNYFPKPFPPNKVIKIKP